MRTQDLELTQDLEIYCQSDGLLIQFILRELADIFINIKPLIKCYKALEKTPSSEPNDKLLEEMRQHIKTLTSYALGQRTLPPWTTEKGHLEKLLHYCYLLATRTDNIENEKLFYTLYQSINQAFQSCTQCKEHHFLMNASDRQVDMNKNFFNLLDTLKAFFKEMDKVHRLIDKILFTFREDENVLYLLIAQAPHFNTAFGRNFIEKIAQKLYSGGMKEISKVIQVKYQDRGFPEISKRLNKSIKALSSNGS